MLVADSEHAINIENVLRKNSPTLFGQIKFAVILTITLNALPLFTHAAEPNAKPEGEAPASTKSHSGNPVISGWYADPEAAKLLPRDG